MAQRSTDEELIIFQQRSSVGCRSRNRVDDDHVERRTARLELEAELLSNRLEDVKARIAARHGQSASGVRQLEVKEARKSSSIDHSLTQRTCDLLRNDRPIRSGVPA